MSDQNYTPPEPDKERIEFLLRITRPQPGMDFYRCMESMPWNKEERVSLWKRTQLRGILTVVGIILFLIFIIASPTMEVVANRIAKFFMPTSKEQVTIEIPFFQTNKTSQQILWDIDEASNQVGFYIKSPSFVPLSYSFGGVELRPDRQAIVLNYDSRDGSILRISQRRDGLEYQSISKQARIETIRIGNHIGEYVAGAWKATQNDRTPNEKTITLNATWDTDANVHFLRWQEDDILYEIIFIGDNSGSEDYLDKDALVAIAENLH